jgi:hypothetical protein
MGTAMVQRYLMLLLAVAFSASSSIAQSGNEQKVKEVLEFRIDTDVYLDQSKPPVSSTKTIFLRNRIIDWDDAKRRMLSIDLASQQIELADFSTQRRCRIDMRVLESRMSNLRSQLTPEQVQAWSSTAQPVPDGEGYERIQSGNLMYRFKAIHPKHPQMAIDYSEFANWTVQVSAIYPPYKPPLLRMQLNDFLAEQQRLPMEVQLIDLRSTSQEPVVARLLVQETLSNQDRERVKDWDVLVATLKLVSDTEYFPSQRLASERSAESK